MDRKKYLYIFLILTIAGRRIETSHIKVTKSFIMIALNYAYFGHNIAQRNKY